MHISHVSLSVFLASYTLCIAAAALSQSSPVTDEHNFPNSNRGNVERLPVPLATAVPFAYNNILFEFTVFEDPIPKDEVGKVLKSADEAIADLVDDSPSQTISNNRFEHRAPNGNTLVSIQAKTGKEITWAQLYRVLQGLSRFMVGMGAREQHCRVLDFAIAIAGMGRVGFGVVRYFPRLKDQVQKRSIMPASNALLNKTVLYSLNGSSSSSASTVNPPPLPWPIPRTSLLLSFHFLGMPIPEQNVKATLQGAIAEVRPWSTSEDMDDAMQNDAFDWTLPPNGDGTRTGVTVLAYHNCVITWKQLSQILFGLYQFTTALDVDGGQHFHVLGFRIINQFNVKIGVGTLSYYPRRVTNVERRASDAGQDYSQLLTLKLPALATGPTQTPIRWPVRDTSVVLDFKYLGQDIPSPHIIETLSNAQIYIAHAVREQPSAPIVTNRFHFKPPRSNVYINVVTIQHGRISWPELSQVLFGVMQFCDHGHHQVLVFDVDIEGARAGFGTLLYVDPEPSDVLEKRMVNGTLTMPNLIAGSSSIPYNIPNTKDYLDFNTFGSSIPSSKLVEFLTFILRDISEFVQGIPDALVPRNRYVYDDESGMAISILPSTFHQMTWLQLDKILTGLMYFVTGVNPHPGGDLRTHFQALKFNVIMQRQGYIGTGIIGYKPPRRVEVEKRDAIGKESVLRSPSTKTIPGIIHPIHNTSARLSFTDFGSSIPARGVNQAIVSALERLKILAELTPQHLITENLFQHIETQSNGEGFAVSVSGSTRAKIPIGWMLLYQVLGALQVFMNGDGSPSTNHGRYRQELEFDIILQDAGKVGAGAVRHFSSRGDLSERSLANTDLPLPPPAAASPMNSNETIIASAIPFRVPNTPVTLILNPLNTPISAQQVLAMLLEGRAKIASSVARRPNSRVPRNWVEYTTAPDSGGGATSILVHAYSGHNLTWSIVDDVFAGLTDFLTKGPGAYRPCLRFEVDYEEVGRIGLGTMWYTPGRHIISERVVAPARISETAASTSATSELHSKPQQLKERRSSGNTPVPDLDQSDIPFPIIGTDITLVFTKLGVTRIPIDTVNSLFDAITEDIQSSTTANSSSAIPDPLWYFKVGSAGGGATLSLSIYTSSTHKLTWIQLRKILSGLQLFMCAQRSPLNFDIDIGTDVEVGKGVIWYSPPRPLKVTQRTLPSPQQPTNSTSPLTLTLPNPIPIPYPIPFTPLTLNIYLSGPAIPRTNLSAFLTNALQHIHPNATTTPTTALPNNVYVYNDESSGLAFNYIGYTSARSLTWQQLRWVLRGLLAFGGEGEGHCRGMAVEIDVGQERLGFIILWGFGGRRDGAG